MLSWVVLVADLVWSAPAECPSREDVDRDVQALAHVREDATSADARIERVGREWRLALSIEGGPPRVLVAPTCAELGSAVAAILAARASMSEKVDAPLPELPALPVDVAPASLQETPPPAREIDRGAPRAEAHERFAAALTFGGALGVPGTTASIRASSSWTPGAARIELYGAWSAPRTLDGLVTSTTYSLAIGGGRGCATLRRGPFTIAPCAGGEGGVVSWTAVASNDPSIALSDTKHNPWIAATAGALLTARTGPVVLRVDVEAVVPVFRTMDSADTFDARTAWAIVPRAFAGAELPIP